MTTQKLVELFEKIVENYHGTILVVDHTGQIVYVNENVCVNSKLSKEALLSHTIYDLVESGVFRTSSTVEVLETKEPSSKIIEGNIVYPLLTTSKPVFDREGTLQYVIAYSQDIAFVDAMTTMMEMERQKTKQIMNYVNDSKNDFVVESDFMKGIRVYLDKISGSDSTVLLYGESGTGKEVIARYIYRKSNRKHEIFLPINCAAFPAELMESELFGYEKGAFTGASKEGKPGLFELADKGTLFLDEIGDLPLSLQSKLLRVLETGEIKKLGSDKIMQVDVRVIAATNRDLEQMVKEKQFREDLFYRLNILPVSIPPIRSRKADIIPLTLAFLGQHNQLRRYGQNKSFSPKALDMLMSYNWPGNVREIRNVVERLYITSASEVISANEVHAVLYLNKAPVIRDETLIGEIDDISGMPYKEALQRFEKKYIEKVMGKNGQNVAKSAADMNISRSDLYYKLSKFKTGQI